MRKRLAIPAALAVIALGTACDKKCKRCVPYTVLYDAGPDADPPPATCPDCIDSEQACPVGCIEPPEI